MTQLIEPRTLKGFRDYLPEVMIARERLMETARRVYRRFGFSPIDTPALEYLEILSGKGSEETDRQTFAFQHGKHRVGMRFDLTIPLARFAAEHHSKLGMPFKRYHIAPVWRGENPQAGRYREFVQCDFDTIGTESVAADVETALVIHDLFHEIGISKFQIRINNRRVLNGLLERQALSDRSQPILRAIDKLEKLGPEVVMKELVDVAQLTIDQAKSVLELCNIAGDNDSIIDRLKMELAESQLGTSGIKQIEQLHHALQAAGVEQDRYSIDVTIARGLDYYTGVVFETILEELPAIGSVCSGGRYDNLAGLYTKEHLPGIGASLGLDRLIAALEQLNRLEKSYSTADIFVAYFDADRLNDYVHLAQIIRKLGYNVELYPDPKKLGLQLKYADQKGFRVAIIAGSNELDSGTCQVKDLRQKSAVTVGYRDDVSPLAESLRTLLSL